MVDKPAGWTSHDVVGKLRRVFGLKRVGHAGTLDPAATGVLLVGVGRVTRLMRFLSDTGKVYRGEVGFGVATDTLDAAGQIREQAPMPGLARADVEVAVKAFVGEIQQVPPMVSAIKVGGKRLHELARRGEVVERAPRTVRINRIEVEDFAPGEFPRATLTVECGSGTYIRSLADDLGRALGGCAHLAALRRLAVGPFGLADARSIEAVEADPAAALLPPVEAVRHLDRIEVDGPTAEGVRHGAVFPAPLLSAGEGPLAVIGPAGELLAVYARGRAAARPLVVMSGA